VKRRFANAVAHGMISLSNRCLFLLCILVVCFGGLTRVGRAQREPSPAAFSEAELKEFLSVEPIDVHTHLLKSHPEFNAMLKRLHVHVLNIFVGDPTSGATQESFAILKQDSWQAVESSAGRAQLSTTFNPFDWNRADFPRIATESINKDFGRGAAGVTIWSNGFTRLKDSSGNFVSADDPRLEPVYKDLLAHNKTFIAHLGGPEEAWAPESAAAANGAGSAVLVARDRVIAQNPHLRVVGAHLGSTKEDLDQLAQRLDRFPNFAVDTSGRVPYLMGLPPEKAIDFLTKYQDQILYGSDLSFRSTEHMEDLRKTWEERYASEWRFFATDATFTYQGHQVHGLNLHRPILRKLYHDNAAHWIPGIVP
jgi:Amidohydrolase